MRTVREGAGLIAQINGATPTVTKCYSATWWESLPPVAYGTFKGDQNNFFVYQTLVEMPVTVNVAAVFKYSGANNVFSLQKDAKGNVVHYAGIPCTVTDLNKKFLPEDGNVSPELSFGSWQKATKTYRWTANGDTGDFNCFSDNAKDYPFPIPSNKENNAEFYGDWIKSDARDESTSAAAVKDDGFKGYYYLHFSNSDGATGKTDPGLIRRYGGELSIIKNTVSGFNEVCLPGYYTDAYHFHWGFNDEGYNSDKMSLKDMEKYSDESKEGEKVYYYWALGGSKVYSCDAAKTEVSVSGTDFVFTYAPYYDKGFDPLNPFNEVTNWTKNGNFNLGNSTLCWDFYGYFFMADYNSYVPEEKYKKYYIKFGSNVAENTLRRGEGENDGYIYVNETSFKNALNFETKTLSSNVEPRWNSENGVFSVENK